MVYHTLTPDEEAEWLRAVQDGSLWPYKQEWEESEQMWLWRQAGHFYTEIAAATMLQAPTVYERVRLFERREEAT